MDTILRIIKEETQWPNIKGYRVEVEVVMLPKKETAKINIFLTKEEYVLRMYIQNEMNIKNLGNNPKAYNKLWKLIEDYGQSKYSQGYDEADMNAAEMAAGEDI